MDKVVGDGERVHVAVNSEGLAAPSFQVVQLIAADGDVVQRRRGLGSVEGNPQRVGVASGSRGHNVMNMVVENLQLASRSGDPDTHGNLTSRTGFVVADFESLDDHVALAGEVEQSVLSTGNTQPGTVDNRRLSRIVLEGDVAGSGGAGCRNIHGLVVGSTQHLDGVSRHDVIGSVLDVAPGAGRGQSIISVAARGGHVVGAGGGDRGRQENTET